MIEWFWKVKCVIILLVGFSFSAHYGRIANRVKNVTANPYPNGGYDYSQPQQTVDGRPDPRALAGLTEQQRREYEGQWAAYEQQLAMYNAQQAAVRPSSSSFRWNEFE